MNPSIHSKIAVIKRNLAGQETWRYTGQVLQTSPTQVVVEAFFDREDLIFYGLLLRKGDRFIETYFTDRWYNIFDIYDHKSGARRGWYCNICFPAVMEKDGLSYIDLALDLLVFPDGQQVVLDESEFNELEITPDAREQALAALHDLQARFLAGEFNSLSTGSKPAIRQS